MILLMFSQATINLEHVGVISLGTFADTVDFSFGNSKRVGHTIHLRSDCSYEKFRDRVNEIVEQANEVGAPLCYDMRSFEQYS